MARSILGMTAIAVASLTLLAASAGAQSTQRCADIRFTYREHGTSQYVLASNIRARKAGCRKARRLGHTYARAYRNNYGHPAKVGSFSCRWNRLGTDVGSARCRNRDGAFVSFGIYDSSPYH